MEQPGDLDPGLRSAIDLLFSRPPEVDVALARLTARCLDATGLLVGTGSSAEAVEQALVGAARPERTRMTLSGVVPALSVEEAGARGYRGIVASHHAVDPAAGLPASVLAALDPRDGPQVHIDVPGVVRVSEPATGCRAQAKAELFGSVQWWLMVDHFAVTGIRSFGAPATRTPEVVEAAAVYQRCMLGRGYDVATPAHGARTARVTWVEGDPSGVPSHQEIDMARADALCQAESGVQAVLDAAVLRLARPWLEQHAATLRETADVLVRAAERARAVLADPPG